MCDELCKSWLRAPPAVWEYCVNVCKVHLVKQSGLGILCQCVHLVKQSVGFAVLCGACLAVQMSRLGVVILK